jgi:hypothetical protein
MSPFAGGPLATVTQVALALPLISLVPLAVEEDLVVSAVLRVMSLARRAVYASEDAPRVLVEVADHFSIQAYNADLLDRACLARYRRKAA